ncbi:inositol monophosphatase family protein [Basilea psittacipulmonis]|uniref:Inositol-1-monophosphatase n=1 Tax=Basilea psittacipulmonis DSM 24701 TaxID=1072685 RepID=A0A077DE00_9BURK|nr:inositol monophosphatase family protein [Basilea psittacipulmonis]AIL32376.1 inositol phosphatase [Basilea psittacipulmonis DSM 24701]
MTSSFNFSRALNAGIKAAKAAATILQAYANDRQQLIIDKKSQNDLVSQADREAEAEIIAILSSETPEFSIIAEESGSSKFVGPATWYIDPLDGTTNYLHAIPQYAVSLGLIAHPGTKLFADMPPIQKATPVVSVVYDPCREEMFTASYMGGTQLNGHNIQCSDARILADSIVGTGMPFRDFSFEEQYMPMLNDAIHKTRGVRRLGSAALDLAWVACGRYDAYWEMALAPWDVAAGTLLVREAGGIAEDLLGHQSWPEKGYVIASNAFIFDEFKAMLTPHLHQDFHI